MSYPTLLVVDDDTDLRLAYVTLLESCGYRVLEAARGEEAVRIAIAEIPDLILMDLSLPFVNGWTAMEVLKDEEATRGIPIIAITGLTTLEDMERAHIAGSAAVLQKPCPVPRLMCEIRRLLRARDAVPRG